MEGKFLPEKDIWTINVVQTENGEVIRNDFVTILDGNIDNIEEFKIAVAKTLIHIYLLKKEEMIKTGSECIDFRSLCQQILFSQFIGYYNVNAEYKNDHEIIEMEKKYFASLSADITLLVASMYTMVFSEVKKYRTWDTGYLYLYCKRKSVGYHSDYDIEILIRRINVFSPKTKPTGTETEVRARAGAGAEAEEE